MVFMLNQIWCLLNLCAIVCAWAAPGSTGFTTFAFSEEQKLGHIPSAAPFVNGSTFQPPLTSHPFEPPPPGSERLPSIPTVSPTQSAVAPSTRNPPGPDTSVKISPSTDPPSSAPPAPTQDLTHDLAPQKPTQAQAHAPQATVPKAGPALLPQPPAAPSSVFAPPPLASPSVTPPVSPLPSFGVPPPAPSKYAPPPAFTPPSSAVPLPVPPEHAPPPAVVTASPPQTKPTHSKAPTRVPSHETDSPSGVPPKPSDPSQSFVPPPQVIPPDVTAPPQPSATPPPVLTPTPFNKSQVLSPPPGAVQSPNLAPPPTRTPYVSAPPPHATISKNPSTLSPLPAPTHESNPPPIVLSPLPGAVPSQVLAPTPPITRTPYVSAPPPGANVSKNPPSQSPVPPPTHESKPLPAVFSPPPGTVPSSHDLAPHVPYVSAPPPGATVLKNPPSQSPLPAPTHESKPLPVVSSPPPVTVPSSRDLAPPVIPRAPSVSAPPPGATISESPPTESPRPTPTHESIPPPIGLSPPPGDVPPQISAPPPLTQSPLPAPTNESKPLPAVLSPPPANVPSSHDLPPPPNHTVNISAPPPSTISRKSPAPLPAPPIQATNPPPRVMPPTVSPPPPDAVQPPPRAMPPIVSPPPPDAVQPPPRVMPPTISPPPPDVVLPPPRVMPPTISPPPPDAVPPPPRVMPPTVSPPPPDAVPPHNSTPPAPESHFSTPPPAASISRNSTAPLPAPPINITNAPPRSIPPPDAAPSRDLAPSSPVEPHFSAPPPSPASKNASTPPSSSVPSHASAPSTTAPPPSVHTLPSGSSPPVTSNSSAPVEAPPIRSPAFHPIVPRESPSISPEAPLPRVSSPAPSIERRGHQVPVHVAPTGPKHASSPTNDHPEQGFTPSVAPSAHKSRPLPTEPPAVSVSPPISPKAEATHSPSFSPKQQGRAESPRSSLAPVPETTPRYHAPTSHNPGFLVDLGPSQSPSTEDYIAPAPVSVMPDPSGHSMAPVLSPKVAPSVAPIMEPNIELAPPMLALPPPPPNHDCLSYTCLEPFTNTIPGSPCGCVRPMKVKLRIGVPVYTFFPLVPELAREIATGIFMKQSQVRVMEASAASEQPEKTLLLIDLVPLGDKFDNITALLIFERFWNKRVAISKSLFGDYDVLFVLYPGLPNPPPLPPSDSADMTGDPTPGANNATDRDPLGVDVSKKGRKHKLSGSLIAIVVFSAVGAVLLCLLLGWILLFGHRRHVSQLSEAPQIYPSSVARSMGPTGHSNGSRPSFSLSFESSVAAYTGSAKTFSASEIEKATDNFNDSRVLGEGGFGRVYSGVLEDGTEVAVKVLKREDQQGGREFLAEIEMLSRLHHRNLVKLIGICVEEHARCLVYELIHNGSVESHLHGIDKESSPLDWATRVKIALGSARGLAYLHEDSSPRVIHRDFKASNILLETDFTPKVSDFGLARTALDEENRHISTRVMGTFGYVAPEYAMTGHLLVKSDVYSYGVVLLELLTGRKPVDMSQPPGQENLVAWTRPYLTTKEALKSIVDPSLGPDICFDNVAKVGAIASMCVQPEVSHRPFMGEVVQALKLVWNECDGAKDDLGSSPRSEELDRDRDVEKALSTPDVLCENACRGSGSDSGSGSGQRHFSSGPIGGGKSWRFWKRGRTESAREEDGGENGVYRFWSGSH